MSSIVLMVNSVSTSCSENQGRVLKHTILGLGKCSKVWRRALMLTQLSSPDFVDNGEELSIHGEWIMTSLGSILTQSARLC